MMGNYHVRCGAGEKPEVLAPEAYLSLLGQTNVFVRRYGDIIRFSFATGYLYYDGKVWIENKSSSSGTVIDKISA